MCFLTAKSTKNSRHKSRKSFKALARELLCNITHPPISCRSCLNVSISGTTELAFHAQASTLFSTAQTSAVQFPLLKLTLTLAQHHADFKKKLPFANKTSVHVGAGLARPNSDYCELSLIHNMTARLFFGCTVLLTCEAEGDFLQHRKKDFAL